MMLKWRNQHYPPKGVKVNLVNIHTSEIAEPIVIDKKTGEEITLDSYQIKVFED
jgi:hypothetical protein